MQTPLPDTYYLSCDTKKVEVQRYQMFFGHFKVESRVTSVAWADASPSNFYLHRKMQVIGLVLMTLCSFLSPF
jgi:hypothetical protein